MFEDYIDIQDSELKNSEYFNEDEFSIAAEELRQYLYCPRIPVLRHIRKIQPSHTYMVNRGTQFHQNVVYSSKRSPEFLEILKKIKPEHSNIEQYHDLVIKSPAYHLEARLDLFERDGDTIYPVEIKTGNNPGENRALSHYIQLTVQALLLEEKFQTAINKARIIYLGTQDSVWVDITLELKQKVLKAIDQIKRDLKAEEIPPPTPDHEKCPTCEYYRYCQRA